MQATSEPIAVLTEMRQHQKLLGQAAEILLEEHEKLSRMMDHVRREIDNGSSVVGAGELSAIQEENASLRFQLEDRDKQIVELNEHLLSFQAELEQSDKLREGLILAQRQLQEKDKAITRLRNELEEYEQQRSADPDKADYEAELNEFRRQVETDRAELQRELASLRSRHQELNDAVREAELEMSRERAQIARDRIHLERFREEARQEIDRLIRDAGISECLAPVQRLKAELSDRRALSETAAANDKEKTPTTGARWRFLQGSGK